jgi:hypothetical protein
MHILKEIKRSEVIELNPYAKDADYAEVSKITGNIQMFYRHFAHECEKTIFQPSWHYLSFANLWMGSSDNMENKYLLKIVDD